MRITKRILIIILCCVTIFSCCATYFFTPVKVYASDPITYWTFEELVSYFMAAMGLSTSSTSANKDAWHNVCERMASDITDSASLPAAYLKGVFGVVSTMNQNALATGTIVSHELWANMTQAISNAWNEVYGTAASLFIKSYTGDTSFYLTTGNYINMSGSKYAYTLSFNADPGIVSVVYTLDSLYIYLKNDVSYNLKKYQNNNGVYNLTETYNNFTYKQVYNVNKNYYTASIGTIGSLESFSTPYPVFNNTALSDQYLIDNDKDNALQEPTIAYPLAIPASIGNVLDGSAIGTPSTVADLAAAIAGALADTFPAALDPAAVPDTSIDKAKDDTKKVIAPAITIPTAANDNSLSYKFDLKDLFPFCIPFDLIDFLSALEATREAPKFNFPVNIKYDNPFTGQTIINYSHTFILDFAEYEAAAAVFRTCMLITVIVGLIILTRNIIRG